MANPGWESPAVHSKNRVWNGSEWVKQTSEVSVGGSVDSHLYTWDVDTLSWVPQPPIGAGFGSGDASEATLALVLTKTGTVDTSVVYNGVAVLTPKYAVIDASDSGDNTIVVGVVGKKIRVLAYNFIAAGTVTATFQSDAAGTDLTGPKPCVANSGLCANFNPVGWFETIEGELLNLDLSGNVAVGGELTYVEV